MSCLFMGNGSAANISGFTAALTQAKRDQEVRNIEDTELREKLEKEINSLRKERKSKGSE